MSQRELIRMDDDELEAFLGASSRARVATLSRDGSPHVVPITYVMLDGCLAFWADRDSQKVVNVRRDPRIACIVDDGVEFGELRGVELIGNGEILDDPDTNGRVAEQFLGHVPDEWKDAARANLLELATQRVVVSVKAVRSTSWDHRKLAGVRPQDIGR